MLEHFLIEESGAITVDWVVLTAALVGLGLAVVTMISIAAETPTNALNGTLASDIVGEHTTFD